MMIHEFAQPIIACILGLKLLTSGFFFVASPSSSSPEDVSEPQQIAMASPSQNDDDFTFEDFLAILRQKGMGALNLLEAGAIYFIWTVVKDTKSREELLEKVFEGWSKDEERIRSFGKIFRLLGVSCLGLHKTSIQEIKSYLLQKKKVIVLGEKESDIFFLELKDITQNDSIFVDIYDTEHSASNFQSSKKGLYDVIVFLDDAIFFNKENQQD